MLRQSGWTAFAIGLLLAGCVADPPEGTGPDPGMPDLTPLPIELTNRSAFTKVLCDGDTCLRRLSMTTKDAAEMMVTIDANRPNRILAASQEPIYHPDPSEPMCVLLTYYYSEDGGKTWRDGYSKPASIDRCYETDPIVAFDANGSAYVLALNVEDGIYVYRSDDGTKSWSLVGMAYEGSNDKNWIATDYRRNRLYSITRQVCEAGQAVTWSDDRGAHWSAPVCLKGLEYPQIEVLRNGTLVAMGSGADAYTISHSYNGGSNWTSPKKAGAFPSGRFMPGMGNQQYRTVPIVDMAVALSIDAVYAAWFGIGADGSQDVFFARSLDGGNNWSAPVALAPSMLPSDQFMPAVAASPAGDVHIIWMDARNDPTGDGHLLDVYYVHSADGTKFDEPLRLTPESFAPYASKMQLFVGDYLGIAATNERAVAVFPAGTGGAERLVHAAIVGS